MKKGSLVLSLLLAVLTFVSPLMVSAKVSGTILGATDAGMTHTTVTGDAIITYDGENRPKLYLGVNLDEGSEAFKNYTARLTLNSSNFSFSGKSSDISLRSGWTGTITAEGNNTFLINLTHSTGVTTTGRNVAVATLTLDVTSAAKKDDTCTISLSPAEATTEPDAPKCKVDNGKYYCKNGEECTQAEYNKQCTAVENPQTGSFIPYVVIIGGIAVAIGLYMASKKNKIYHM